MSEQEKKNMADKNETLFHTLFEKSADAYLILDGTTFVNCNEATVKILRANSKEEVLSTHPSQLSPEFQPDGRPSGEKANEMVEIALEKGEHRFEWVHQRMDGEDFFVEVLLTPISLEDRTIIHTVWRDITERKEQEATLLRLASIVEASNEAIFSTAPKGEIISWNSAAENMFGYTAEEIIGQPAIILAPPEVREEAKKILMKLMQGEKAPILDTIRVAKDGRRLNVLVNNAIMKDKTGKVLGFSITINDITERKQIEAKQEQLLKIIETSTDFIATAAPDGTGTYINAAGLAMIGYTAEEYASGLVDIRKAQPNLPPDALQTAVEKGFWSGETTLLSKTGKAIPVSQLITAVKDEEGNVAFFTSTARDISEKKEREEQTKNIYERRGYQVQISTEISQEISQAAELSELFNRVVTLTKEQLNYYHTQLLRYDSVQDAVILVAGYGKIGQKMATEGHRMAMGAGLIGTAAATGETILRPNLAEDPDWRSNPLLPDTQGEIAVPIKLGDDVLGVLDVQSDTAGALSEDDQLLLEGLCGQIAIAMEQTRLRQELNEQLEEMNRLYQAMSHEGWQQYRQTADFAKGFIYDQTTVHPIEEREQESFANMPVKLPSGEILGELGIIDDPENPLSEDDKAFIEQVSEQVALALESARLTEQTQIALSQTEVLYQIGSRLNTASNENEILSAAIEPTKDTGYFEASLFYMEDYEGDEPTSMTKVANWHHKNKPALPVGYQLELQAFTALNFLMSPDKVRLIPDIPNSENLEKEAKTIWKKTGSVAIAIIPIYQMGRWLGILTFSWDTPHEFSPSEASVYESMISLVTPVVQSRRLFEQTQAALSNAQLSEARLSSIVDNAPEAILVVDAETSLFVEANKNAENHFGLNHDELLKVGPIQMSPPEQPDGRPSSEKAMEKINAALAGETQVFEWMHRNAKGEDIDSESRLVRMPDPTRKLVRISVVDIRERKKAEQILRESQERAQTILESVTLPMLITRNSDNAITFANQLAADSIGLSIDEITNIPELNLFANSEEREKFITELRTNGVVNNMQILLRRYDESTFWALFSARFFVYQGEQSTLVTIVDISDRIAAQEATAKRAAELATVAEVSTAAARALDTDKLLQDVVDLTRKRFDLYHAHIYLLDEQGETLQAMACGWEEGSPHSGTHGDTKIPLSTERSIVAQAVRNRQAVVVNDVQKDPNWLPNKLMPKTQSEMAVPLIVGEDILGVYDIQSDEKNRFTDEDVSIQTTLASQVAVALQNARSYQQAQQQAEHESLINVIGQRIQGTTSVEDALQVAVRELGRALGAKQASIQLDVSAKKKS